VPIERGITDIKSNNRSKKDIENEINKNPDLISCLGSDLDPLTQIKEFSSLINKASK